MAEYRKTIQKLESEWIQEMLKNAPKIFNKQLVLKKLTFAITENPKGTIEEVIFPKVNFEILKTLA